MKRIIVPLVLLTGLWMTGCNPGPKTVPAEGVLTQKGAPLAGANILVMYPDNNSATGTSDKDGKFSLTYLGKNGAMPGTDLKVGIQKQAAGAAIEMPTSSGGGPPKDDKEAMANMQKMMDVAKQMQKRSEEQMKKGGGTKDLIDAKYRSPDTSGLKLTIPPDGSKDLKIDLPM